MGKKLWAIIIVVILLAISAAGYIYFSSGLKTQENPFSAVPNDAALIIRTADFKHLPLGLREESLLWNELRSLDAVKRADRDLAFIDSLIGDNDDFNRLFGNRPFLVSVHQTGKKDLELLLLMNLPPAKSYAEIEKSFSDLYHGEQNFESRKYQKSRIIEVPVKDGQFNYHFSIYKGVFIFSSSPILVESAVRQLDLEQNIMLEEGFAEVNSTAGKSSDANIYINFGNFHRFLSVFLDDGLGEWTRHLDRYSNWTELDMHIEDDKILMNGFSYSDTDAGNFLNLFLGQDPVKIGVDRVLPENTVSYLAMGLSDINSFFMSRLGFLKANGKFEEEKKKMEKIKSLFGSDPLLEVAGLLDDEVVLAYTDIKNAAAGDEVFGLVKVRSAGQARESFSGMLKEYAKNTDRSYGELHDKVIVDNETSFEVFSFPGADLPSMLFGGMFRGPELSCISFVGDYVLFAHSKRAISTFVKYYVVQQTLHNNMKYREFLELLSSRSNLVFYSYLPRSAEFLSSYLNDEFAGGLKKNEALLKKVQAAAFQFSLENSMFYNNLVLKYQSVYKERAETEWESLMDATILSKPVFVTNHRTGDKEIFVQDSNNNAYLINSAGRILWKLDIGGQIMSDVFQIDYYKNNKLQLLFNTAGELHLIDRNGNYVEKYPVKLRSGATNGLQVFDYERNRDYRICIAGEDKKIYLLDKDAKTIDGWKTPVAESPVTDPVRHFRSGTRDYIVYSDKYNMHILNRRGDARVELKERIEKPEHQNILLCPVSGEDKLVTSSADGTVFFIGLDGSVSKKRTGEFGKGHYFDYRNLDGAGGREFIFLDGKQLQVFSSGGKKLFSKSFNSEVNQPFFIYSFSSRDLKIGVLSENEEKIYLFNNNGKLYNNFPLRGHTLFSIGKFRSSAVKYNLLVGGDENFLYNYSLN